ncbi:hypothetical protein [Aquimarina sp. MMG016]|uniref:hypothetical protein n=1 Tax=Aquimarina sp. MMG016 TaxID=2822690 RepID=UPI001B39F52F|nr:hypothetical protein [Aquimarina sp. MMG016]MBQ4821535.1 hypothetical protein [Aquimarina sp. MMG016]
MFQEDLQQQVKASISEKSFYSYFKNSSEKLPRIDILNLLSQYCEYDHWNDFKNSHSASVHRQKKVQIPKWFWFFIIGSIVITGVYFMIPAKTTFSFCFIDQDRNQPITDIPIDVIILNNSESPFYVKSDSSGCFTWKTKDEFIHFVVQSPYHKSDTIYRIASSDAKEDLQIKTDDYALMLHYYANGKVDDWKNRRKELSQMISNEATIFQVLPHGLGIEIYTKHKFINTLTTPTQSLKNIEIIESRRSNGQIVKLKFKVKS